MAQERHEKISLIAALGRTTRVIGKDGDLLWHIPADLKRFKALTSGHAVIMGRKTWESLPEKYRPLPDRANIVVTRQENYEAEGALVCPTLDAAFEAARDQDRGEIFVIGGGDLYTQALRYADKLYLTLVDSDAEGDVYFPEYEKEFTDIIFEEHGDYQGLDYTWLDLEKI